ncbi:hypothetical protein [Pseudaquabacterium pictum]|uniref:Uncharacterized protein n=1 Tax=Pseudaquabacterium pictum TaxID=2315236 RepID=A0A480AXU1_9BURK|nr:hypothetical protein [Rubrivivax pictus]GCL66274.1 hypothetical protein AQPW35_53550 [Rubrivivax pictus]
MSPSPHADLRQRPGAVRRLRGGRLDLLLTPDRLTLRWQGPWPGRQAVQWQQPVAGPDPAQATAAADAGLLHQRLLAALAAALRAAPRPITGSQVHLQLDHGLAPLGVLRGDLHQLTRPALAAAAQRWFSRQLEAPASTLQTCVVPQADGRHLLAATIDGTLLDHLRALLAAAGLRLASARPALVPALVAAEVRRQGLLARRDGLHLQLACRQHGAWTRLGEDDLDHADDLEARVQAFAARCDVPRPWADAAVAAAGSADRAPVVPVRRGRQAFSASQLDFCGAPLLSAPAAGLLAGGVLSLALVAGLFGSGALAPPALPVAAPAPARPPAAATWPPAVQAGLQQVQAELRTPWLTALAPLAAVEPRGVQLLAVEPDPVRGRLRIEAWAPDALAMVAWMQRAEAVHAAGQLLLDGWQPGRDAQGVRFALQIRWSEPAAASVGAAP